MATPLREWEYVAGVALFGLVKLVAGVFYPVSSLPVVLRPISEVLPTTHAFAAGRSLATGSGMPWDEFWLAAGTTTALTAVARLFRRWGYVTHYS